MIGISGSAPLPPNVQAEFEQKASGGIMEGYGLSEMSPVTHLNASFMIRVGGGRLPTEITTRIYSLPGMVPFINRLLRTMKSKTTGKLLGGAFGRRVKRSSQDQHKSSTEKNVNVEKRGTIGIPFPDTEIKFVDVDTGKVKGLF